MRMKLCSLASWLAIIAGALLVLPAAAQNYPVKPVRIVVPYPPGGIGDTVTRALAQGLGEQLG